MKTRLFLMLIACVAMSSASAQQKLTFVEYNVENIFDTRHDEGKQDEEFLPEATRQWTEKRYWRKLDQRNTSCITVSKSS